MTLNETCNGKKNEMKKKLGEARFHISFIKSEIQKAIDIVDPKSIIGQRLKKIKEII